MNSPDLASPEKHRRKLNVLQDRIAQNSERSQKKNSTSKVMIQAYPQIHVQPEGNTNKTNSDRGDQKSTIIKRLPKNVNEYRHIIDTFQSRDSDVEWILGLKTYNKGGPYFGVKDVTLSQPEFYNADFQKYKTSVELEAQEKKANTLKLSGNSRDFEHVIKARLNMPANPGQIGFDSTLRQFEPYENIHGPKAPWKTLAISPKKNLLNKYLPPVKASSYRNLTRIDKFVSRPYIQKEDVKLK